jgi:hypothetical protein
MESEGPAEMYRAVIDEETRDETVGQRWGKVESALPRRRRSHSPTAPRCLRTAQYGRTARDFRRTGRVPGVSGPISRGEVASDALSVVGRLNSTYEAQRKPRDRATGDGTGSGNSFRIKCFEACFWLRTVIVQRFNPP